MPADLDRLQAARPSRVADRIAISTDPGIVVGALVGFVAAWSTRAVGPTLGWSAATIAFCVLLPYAALALLLRSGRVSDRQIVRREQRLVPGLAALACLVAGLVALWLLGAPRDLLVLMVANVAGLVTLLAISRWWKISLHTAVGSGAATIVGVLAGWPWGLALAPLVAVVGWARWRAGRHTVPQVVAGAAVGALVSGLVFGLGTRDPVPSWRAVPVSLPGPVTAMAPLGDRLLLGTYAAAARPRVGLHLLDPARPAALTAVPLAPNSPYAYEGSWRFLATDGPRVLGVAGVVGGAHGNVRWTIWHGDIGGATGDGAGDGAGGAAGGDPGGVTETEQPFFTFGGYDMGSLTGAGMVGGREVIFGSWKSASSGLDIATWQAGGTESSATQWSRTQSPPAALTSTPSELVSAVAAIPDGSGSTILLGSTTRLGNGAVTTVPSIWTAESARVWTRHDLPRPAGVDGLAWVEAGTCSPRGTATAPRCLLAGRVGDRLTVWTWDGAAPKGAAVHLRPGPGRLVTLADADRIVGVSLAGRRAWIVLAHTTAGSSSHPQARAGEPAGEVVTARHTDGDGGWSVAPAPGGTPTALATVGDRVYLATDGPAGPKLWSMR